MAVSTVEATETVTDVAPEHVPTPQGLVARAFVATALTLLVFALPLVLNNIWDDRIALAAIYGIIGLSINIITGYAGQISLGHQAFVGIGAFMSAYMVGEKVNSSFFVAVPVAGLTGAFLAFCLGLVALRIRGLYLALITLSFGLMAQSTIFSFRPFTGGGGGAPAPRPGAFTSHQAYAYLCLLFLGLFILVDWRVAKTKAGRAIISVRNNERVAATLGINVTAFKLMAFVVGGFIAGTAGSLYAHKQQFVVSNDFEFTIALVWILMAVVGGLGSRAGVVVGSAFFALFPYILEEAGGPGGWFGNWWVFPVGVEKLAVYTPLIGAILLLLTVTKYPGGIGQQLLPIRRWLAGGPFKDPHHRKKHRGRKHKAAKPAEQAQIPTEGFDEQPSVQVEPVPAGGSEPPPEAGGSEGPPKASDGQPEPTTKLPVVPPRPDAEAAAGPDGGQQEPVPAGAPSDQPAERKRGLRFRRHRSEQ